MSDDPVAAPGGATPSPRSSPVIDRAEVERLARWWFGPLAARETWAAAGYLTVGLVAGITWFVATVVVLAVSLPLLLVLIGFPLTSLALGVVGAMAGVEQRRAAWVGVTIEPRALRRSSGGVDRLWVRLADPARWRQVAWFLVGVLAWPLAFGLAAAVWSFGIQATFSALSGNVVAFVVQALLAVASLGLAPRLTVWVAHAAASATDLFLGRDRNEALQERVDALAEQRSAILDAVAGERRRIERNLHDGVQQRMVALGIDLGMAAQKIDDDPEAARRLIDEAREKARASIGELRTIGRGLHPAILEDRGLDAALSALVAGSAIPVTIDVPPGLRLPADTEETAYFVAAEAVANVLKHSGARAASVKAFERGGVLHLSIHDDGSGGADPAAGTGLAGMAARVRGVDGRFDLHSPPGGPTTLTIELPHG